MARLLAAAVLLTLAAAPAIACDWQKSTSNDTQKRTAASQPAYNHSTPVAEHDNGPEVLEHAPRPLDGGNRRQVCTLTNGWVDGGVGGTIRRRGAAPTRTTAGG